MANTQNNSRTACSIPPPRPSQPPPGYKFAESVSTGRRKDPSWKHGVEVIPLDVTEKKPYIYVMCLWCHKVTKGGVARLKEHLAKSKKNVELCPKVPEDVKNQMAEYLKRGVVVKQRSQLEFEECVEVGSYFGSGMDGEGGQNTKSGPSGSSAGSRKRARQKENEGPSKGKRQLVDEDEEDWLETDSGGEEGHDNARNEDFLDDSLDHDILGDEF